MPKARFLFSCGTPNINCVWVLVERLLSAGHLKRAHILAVLLNTFEPQFLKAVALSVCVYTMHIRRRGTPAAVFVDCLPFRWLGGLLAASRWVSCGLTLPARRCCPSVRSSIRPSVLLCSGGEPLREPRPQAGELPSLVGGAETEPEEWHPSVRAQPDKVNDAALALVSPWCAVVCVARATYRR